MKPGLEKALRLVALAASSNLEEARTAAYQACKLIREHELLKEEKKPLPVVSATIQIDAPPPTTEVHLTRNGLKTFCGTALEHGENFLFSDQVCFKCLELRTKPVEPKLPVKKGESVKAP